MRTLKSRESYKKPKSLARMLGLSHHKRFLYKRNLQKNRFAKERRRTYLNKKLEQLSIEGNPSTQVILKVK